jgi:membrane-associated protease RseP (regulator of RpoE activity)
MRLIVILTMLMIAVTAHEYGHYRVMLANGVEVREFAVGIGPVLWQKPLSTGTMFQLRALPLGGFVKPAEGAMEKASPWVNLRIAMAGMFANSLFAFLVLLPCYLLGLKQPDFLTRLRWFAFLGPRLTSPIAALVMSFGLWLAMPFLIVSLLVKGGLREFFRNVAGPIGILSGRDGQESSGQASADDQEELTFGGAMLHLAAYLASLNAALAGFNLLPLLPLDGGVAFGAVISGVFGPSAGGFLSWYADISLAVFLLLVVSIFVNDIVRLFRRRS